MAKHHVMSVSELKPRQIMFKREFEDLLTKYACEFTDARDVEDICKGSINDYADYCAD
jgi:hypothetical protein